MPAKSGKQYRFMAAVANGGLEPPDGLSRKTAKDFVDKTPEDKRKKFAKAFQKKRK